MSDPLSAIPEPERTLLATLQEILMNSSRAFLLSIIYRHESSSDGSMLLGMSRESDLPELLAQVFHGLLKEGCSSVELMTHVLSALSTATKARCSELGRDCSTCRDCVDQITGISSSGCDNGMN